jgi:cystathionine beta-lyase/cystathionine gamma-synthase
MSLTPRSNNHEQSYSASRRASSSTTALHGKLEGRRTRGPLVTPIVQSTTYLQSEVGVCDGPTYSRVGNPTVDELERVLGDLEDAPPSVTFSTGLAAETALFLTLLRAGDHAVIGEAVYGGTVRLFRQVLNELGITSTFVDSTDVRNVERAITPQTKMVFIETPANPTLVLTDVREIARISKAAGAVCVVDNTFMTPVLQQPLELGADVSVYSTTKHIDGHSAALGGAVTSRDAKLIERLRWIRKCTGSIQTPFNAWVTLQGLKTLPIRLERQSENALEIAQWLAGNPGVTRVCYPGLQNCPQRDLAESQHIGGHGGVIAFEIAGGVEAGRALMNSVRLCRLVEHIGSVETLITHPASMTHADVPRDQRDRVGLTDGLVRLSVGLEEPAEVIADLEQAIAIGVEVGARLGHVVEGKPVDAAGIGAVVGSVKAEGGVACRTR